MSDEVTTTTKFVTLAIIKDVFSCEDDKAKEIMNNPDLKKFPVGKTWYVRRDLWDKFIDNVVTFGLPDLSRGFGMVAMVPKHGSNWDFLARLGFTSEQIMEAYKNAKKERENRE